MRLFLLAFMAVICFASCEKDAGEGGNSSITGHVLVKNYTDITFTNLWDVHNGFDEKVFIIYGDEQGVGDDTDTGPDGRFEFKYLRKGKYTVYVISMDTVNATPFYTPDTVISAAVEITDRKQTVDAGTLTIIKTID